MNRLNELVEKAFSRQALHTADLPGLDLYMDQVITLVENGYAANKRTAEEKLLTKTMVQNYSKAGLVRPIKGKKYTPGHIVQMLAIYSLKRTLTIGEIKQALDALYAQEGGEQALPDCYERALSQKDALAGAIAGLLEQNGFSECQSRSDAFTSLLTAAALSEAFACLAEGILDRYLPAEQKARRS